MAGRRALYLMPSFAVLATAALVLGPGRERPAVGARVLVALNPNSDTLLVPLTPGYSELLRRHSGYQPPRESQHPPRRCGTA